MNEVTVTRPRHPLAGLRLEVIGSMRKLGREELLVVLPDGSKTLMPADWTDCGVAEAEDGRLAERRAVILAAPADLLHACGLVSGLRARAAAGREQAARKSPCEEDDRAACAAQFDAGADPGATTGGDRVAARGAGRRGDQGLGPADRPSRRGGNDGSRR